MANPPFQSPQAQPESGVRGNVPAPFGAGERLQSPTYRYSESPDAAKTLVLVIIAVSDPVTERHPCLLSDHTRQLVSIDSNPAGLLLRPLIGGRCLRHAEAIGIVGGEIKPGQGRDCHAFFRVAMTTVPETIETIRLCPTCGDKTGLRPQGLCVGCGDHCRDGGLIERDESEVPRVPARNGLVLIAAVALR